MNTLLRANGAEISDPALQDDLSTVLSSCIPNIPNLKGEPITAADLFGGKVRNGRARGEVYEERFDPSPLRARKILVRNREVSCYDLLVDTRSRLRWHLEEKNAITWIVGLVVPRMRRYRAILKRGQMELVIG